MKNLVFVFSVAISLSIISGCGDDTIIDPGPEIESGPEKPIDDIAGIWKLTKIIKDGVDLTDDCTTRSVQTISNFNSFFGDDYDYDVAQNDCLLTKFSGLWFPPETGNGNKYTFSNFGKEFIMELYGDTLTADFVHFFDGQHYLEEWIRQ